MRRIRTSSIYSTLRTTRMEEAVRTTSAHRWTITSITMWWSRWTITLMWWEDREEWHHIGIWWIRTLEEEQRVLFIKQVLRSGMRNRWIATTVIRLIWIITISSTIISSISIWIMRSSRMIKSRFWTLGTRLRNW